MGDARRINILKLDYIRKKRGFYMKKKTIILFLFGLLPIFYQFFNLSIFETKYVAYIPLILILFIGLPIINTSNFIQDKFIIVAPVIFNFIVIPFISFNFGNFSAIIELLNIFLHIVMLLVIIILVSIIDSKESLLSFLKIILVSNSIILTTTIIINFYQVTKVDNYLWFVSERLDRAVFGFTHANTAASYIFLELILLIFALIYYKKKIFILPLLFFVPPLFATGSRTAVISFGIFLIVYVSATFLNRFPLYIRYALSSLIFVFVILVFFNFDWGLLWESSSGRDTRFLYDLHYLYAHDLIWFGIGPINNTSIPIVAPQLYTIDNWYINNTILYGVFGTSSFIIVAFVLLARYLKQTLATKATKVASWGLAFLISFMIYSFFETFLYTPGILCSVIFWVLILAIYKNRDLFSEYNYTNNNKKKYKLTW